MSECFCSWLSEMSVQFTSKVLDFGMLQGSRQCPRHHSCTTYLLPVPPKPLLWDTFGMRVLIRRAGDDDGDCSPSLDSPRLSSENEWYMHNAGLCYFLVTAYPEPRGPVAPRATTTNNKVHVPGRNMYVLSQHECDWCAWNNSTS